MLLIKSLLCFSGYDNGRRFLLISLACYTLFLILSPLLLLAPILIILLLLFTLPVLLASSMRRIHDAAFATPLAAIPVIVFLMTLFGLIYSDSGFKYLLLLLAILVTLATALISNAQVRRQRQYKLGYAGPINEQIDIVQSSQRQYFERIEPTIAVSKNDVLSESIGSSENVTHAYIEESLGEQPGEQFDSIQTGSVSHRNSWEDNLREWLLVKRNVALLIATSLLIIIIFVLIWSFVQPEKNANEVAANSAPMEPVKERNNKIELPDNFWVMTDQYNALTIAWQGTVREDSEVWSPVTAQGDADCVAIRFNNAESYRTMKVVAKNQGDYYADFSPVDSQAIIRAIALQSRFTLCGIEFSLKGTQAKLMNNRVYAGYLTTE